MFARALGVVLTVSSACGSPTPPPFEVASVCGEAAPWAGAVVLRVGDPEAPARASELRAALEQQVKTATRDAALVELDIFMAAAEAGRVFREQAERRDTALRDELRVIRLVLKDAGYEPGFVERLSGADDLAARVKQLEADEFDARRITRIREALTTGSLAASAAALAGGLATLAEQTRRITVDGDHAVAEQMLAVGHASIEQRRGTQDLEVKIVRESSELSQRDRERPYWVDTTLGVWAGLVVVTARLADRWPDTIGATRQRAIALRDGWVVTCIEPTTAPLAPDLARATATLVAARDTLGAALAVVPTTAPSPPPTFDEVYAVFPAR